LVTKDTPKGPKYRLIFDASRCINLHVQPPVVKLSFLQKAVEITSGNDFQATFDIKSAYYHVKIHPDFVKYLGIAMILPSGQKQYYMNNFLPFGINSAVHCITKIFKPILHYVH
jgi:hypothetical protein